MNQILLIVVSIFLVVIIASGFVLSKIMKQSGKSDNRCDSTYCKFPNGSCKNNICVCNNGWSGKNCTTPAVKCDPTKCKSPNGQCINGICSCSQTYAGPNCELLCGDGQSSILCANNLTYKCCDSSTSYCDVNNNCCDTGINTITKLCNEPYTCSAQSFSDIGKCSSDKCPENYCPSMEFIFCDEEKIVKNKMYIFFNTCIDAYKDFEANDSNVSGNDPSKRGYSVDWYWENFNNACLGPTIDNKPFPTYIEISEAIKSRVISDQKINPDTYLYTDMYRPKANCAVNKALKECSVDSTICAPLNQDWGHSKDGGYWNDSQFPLYCADPSYIWSLQKYKYMQFEKGMPNSLLFQICNGFTKSFECIMVINKDINKVCIGMGPRTGAFPSDDKLGTFFTFSDEAQFFPNLPLDDNYGNWTEGVPWVEFEQPICGGMVGNSNSKLRQENVLKTGCKIPKTADEPEQDCGPYKMKNPFGKKTNRPFGSYMFVRIINPSNGKYYRFYLGSPRNNLFPDHDLLKDEFGKPIGMDCNADVTSCTGSQQTLFFFTEDVEYGLEKYLSAKNGTAGIPYGVENASSFTGTRKELELFLWENLEILPLPPQTQDGWQPNSLSAMPNCSLPKCLDGETYWVDTNGYCHNSSAELIPNVNWQPMMELNSLISKNITKTNFTQPEPSVYYSKCKNGSIFSDPCSINSSSTNTLAKIDTSCNSGVKDYCGGGIKSYANNVCLTGNINDLYIKNGNVCSLNSSGVTDKTQLYGESKCLDEYACKNFVSK